LEYLERAKRREERCCIGSGLRAERGVKLDACLEKRESVRIADSTVGIGGIVYIFCIVRGLEKTCEEEENGDREVGLGEVDEAENLPKLIWGDKPV
jgi:hypothetical protein